MSSEDETKRFLALLRHTVNHCENYHLQRLAENRREALKDMARMRDDLKAASECKPPKAPGGK